MIDIKRSNFLLKFIGGITFVGLVIILILFLFPMYQKNYSVNEKTGEASIILPQPSTDSEVSIEEALSKRRSVREYKDEPLTLEEVSQILWAAQGITAPDWGGRTAPSAGALYPLEVYLVVRKVEDIEPGVYHYFPEEHRLDRILKGDVSAELTQAALGQAFISKAAVSLVFSGVFDRTTKKYGERGVHYVYMEAGHAAQNVYLQVRSLGLGTVTVGAFYDEEVRRLLNLSEEETPLYIMPIGRISF